MGKIALLAVFMIVPTLMVWMANGLNWVVSNPTLHTKEVGYLPCILIAFGIFITPKILKRKLK